MESSLSEYYQSQAGKKGYLDALMMLSNPSLDDIVLDVGTGSGTAAFFLAERVKKVYAIDPVKSYIDKNKGKFEQLKAIGKIPTRAQIEFACAAAENINQHFADAFFDTAICWGSIHHFRDVHKGLTNIARVVKQGGKVIIFDAFFPESVRDVWQFVSVVHDPTTVRHHTYFEYMEMLRSAGFEARAVIPFRHENDLDAWLSTMDEWSDEELAEQISSCHQDKYDDWLRQSLPKGLKQALRDYALSLTDEQKRLMSLCPDGENRWKFYYDTFVLLANKK